jgi:MoaA/NifB/PqqE/SkfB family radical SAM enzyme
MEAAVQSRRRKPALLSLKAIRFGPRLAQMVITRKCNLRCGYCNEYDRHSPPVPAETVRRWVDKLAELGCLFVEFTGGETLLHPEAVDLVAYASSYRFLERWIITNGFLLTDDVIRRLNDAGLTHLQLSIDGENPNDTTIKVLKYLRPKIEKLVRLARFSVQVNTVLGAGNDEEAVAVARFVMEAGLRPRVCIIHDHQGRISLGPRQVEILSQIRALMGSRWKESGDYRNRLITDGRADFKCRAGSRYLYIDEFGMVHWCSQQRNVFSKPLLEYTFADLREQFFEPKFCAPTCTVGCVRTASRFDEWRRQGRT